MNEMISQIKLLVKSNYTNETKMKMVTIIVAKFGSWTNSKFTWTHKIHYGWDLGGGTTLFPNYIL